MERGKTDPSYTSFPLPATCACLPPETRKNMYESAKKVMPATSAILDKQQTTQDMDNHCKGGGTCLEGGRNRRLRAPPRDGSHHSSLLQPFPLLSLPHDVTGGSHKGLRGGKGRDKTLRKSQVVHPPKLATQGSTTTSQQLSPEPRTERKSLCQSPRSGWNRRKKALESHPPC